VKTYFDPSSLRKISPYPERTRMTSREKRGGGRRKREVDKKGILN
jgi:hypothetical protein